MAQPTSTVTKLTSHFERIHLQFCVILLGSVKSVLAKVHCNSLNVGTNHLSWAPVQYGTYASSEVHAA